MREEPSHRTFFYVWNLCAVGKDVKKIDTRANDKEQIFFVCDIPLCYDSIIHKICISQNTTIFREQSLCV